MNIFEACAYREIIVVFDYNINEGRPLSCNWFEESSSRLQQSIDIIAKRREGREDKKKSNQQEPCWLTGHYHSFFFSLSFISQHFPQRNLDSSILVLIIDIFAHTTFSSCENSSKSNWFIFSIE